MPQKKTQQQPPLTSVDDALRHITKAMPKMSHETLPLTQAHGRTLAQDCTAKISHPPADVSSMDGYAARLKDMARRPPTLTVIGQSTAGTPYKGTMPQGTTVRIFTGAHLPKDADTIIIQENTARDGDTITILNPSDISAPTQHTRSQHIRSHHIRSHHIRSRGQDFQKGTIIASKGTVLDARRLALLAAAGHATLTVKRQPLIALISTGDELIAPDKIAAGETPSRSQIIASNAVFLSHFLKNIGASVRDLGCIPDQPSALKQALNEALNGAKTADLIITSGGASVGQHDGIAQYMTQKNDTNLAFWRIAMRPGKPLLFGHIGGHIGGNLRKTPLLGLPGNPVSTGVCAYVFVAAALKAMLGQDPSPRYQHAKLAAPLPANDTRQDYLRGRITTDDHGQTWVEAFAQQDSGMLHRFAEADALIIRPPFAPPADTGTTVQIMPL